MKVLFAVNSENVSDSIIKKYLKDYREILSFNNVYYFDAVQKEIQKDKTYDRIVISEDLEIPPNKNYENMDKFIFEKLDLISDEAHDMEGKEIPIILICSDRHSKGSDFLIKLFSLGVYNALLGNDRSKDEVCRLISKPRAKKEAKIYYKIESDNVIYNPENENDVPENEIQSILNHFKKLGRNTDKYARSFEKITEQYNSQQLKVIINCLPASVKEVLRDESEKYQKIMSISGATVKGVKSKTSQNLDSQRRTGIKIDIIEQAKNKKKITQPIVIPGVNTKKENPNKDLTNNGKDDIKKEKTIKNDLDGKKKKNNDFDAVVKPERKKKHHEEKIKSNNELENFDDLELDDEFDFTKKKNKKTGKNIDKKKNKKRDENFLLEKALEEENDDLDFEIEDIDEINETDEKYEVNIPKNTEKVTKNKALDGKIDYSMSSLSSLMTKDKKIVSFVGSHKNGVSFLVNNLAEIFATLGINVAILDMTQNKNSYYIYTKNEETLRRVAASSIEKLERGIAEGIKVKNNITVYTTIPNDGKDYSNIEGILATLVQNYSLVLIDCDFETPAAYFAHSQEIFLVQSMDILTIQALTTFLRDLKVQNILDSEKIKIVINKELKVKGLSNSAIIGGMSSYNEPTMSYMTELFNKDIVRYCSIPFEENVYSKYLEAILNCKISLNGYSKSFMSKLKALADMVYPLTSRQTYSSNYGKTSPGGLSKDMNATLSKMKQSYK